MSRADDAAPLRPLAAGTALYGLSVLVCVALMPADGVPLHLGAGGEVTRTGSRAIAALALVVLGLVMVGIGVGSAAVVRRVPVTAMNIRHEEYWTRPDRVPALRRMMAEDVVGIMTVTVVFLTLLPVALLAAAWVTIPPTVLWGAVGLYALAVVARIVRVHRRYRPPGSGPSAVG